MLCILDGDFVTVHVDADGTRDGVVLGMAKAVVDDGLDLEPHGGTGLGVVLEVCDVVRVDRFFVMRQRLAHHDRPYYNGEKGQETFYDSVFVKAGKEFHVQLSFGQCERGDY